MKIILNEKLRELRRKKDITQEELANRFGISPQAVSKWERGEGFPDITLLPELAQYFDVTIDELMGMEEERMRAKLDAYDEEDRKYGNLGETEKRVALWERAHEEFPNSVRATYALMSALYSNENADKERKKTLERIVALGEALWNDPKAVNTRDGIAQLLAFSYNELGNQEKAKKYAGAMSNIWTCSTILTSHILEGEEGCDWAQNTIQGLADLLRGAVFFACRKGDYSPEMRVRAWKSCIRIFDAIYEDGDYGFYASRMQEMYRELAVAYCKLNDAEHALSALEKRAEFAIMFDTSAGYPHTSPLVNRQKYDPSDTTKNYAHNDSHAVLQGLKNKLYDFIRHDARFEAIIEKLKAVAK